VLHPNAISTIIVALIYRAAASLGRRRACMPSILMEHHGASAAAQRASAATVGHFMDNLRIRKGEFAKLHFGARLGVCRVGVASLMEIVCADPRALSRFLSAFLE
jgi:hypothetical protein